MLAGPNVKIGTMRKAVAHTVTALEVASEVDIDRTEEDRQFMKSLRDELQPVADRLKAAEGAVNDHDLNVGLRLNTRVQLGDAVLDRGVRRGNAMTKMGLKGKSGLDANHVFGSEVENLTAAPIRLEPARVLEAAARLDEVPEFEGREAIKADLVGRAQRQEKLLAERDQGAAVRSRLVSEAVKAVTDANAALIRAKGLLDGRFPRQRMYVAEMFYDVTPSRRPRPAPAEPEKAA